MLGVLRKVVRRRPNFIDMAQATGSTPKLSIHQLYRRNMVRPRRQLAQAHARAGSLRDAGPI